MITKYLVSPPTTGTPFYLCKGDVEIHDAQMLNSFSVHIATFYGYKSIASAKRSPAYQADPDRTKIFECEMLDGIVVTLKEV